MQKKIHLFIIHSFIVIFYFCDSPCMYFFSSCGDKKLFFSQIIKVNWLQCHFFALVPHWLSLHRNKQLPVTNTFFCVLQKKVSDADLERPKVK